MKTLLILALSLVSLPAVAAKDFEVFDGQYYNGQFYPLIDNIEWGEADHELPHMEFHIHQKDKPVGVSVVSGTKGGKPVLWIMYDLAYRAERVCRRVLAPAQFKENQKLFLYRDDSDPDYDNVYIYSEAWKQKGKKTVPEYTMPAYERCSDENADNMPMPADSKAPAVPGAPAVMKGPSPASVAPPAGKAKGLPVDYDNTAVPFSF
ncbi:MAG: hypothetical protein ACXVB9_10960 [Bdellovibrionota bacterium]